MGGVGQYAVSVVATAIICSILSSIATQSTAGGLLKLISGVVLTLVVIRPFTNLELPSLGDITFPKISAGETAAEAGNKLAQDTMTDIIKSTCEAYILDKATGLGAEIRVNIFVNSDHIPTSAVIRGGIDPSVKEQLRAILETDLGITKENQSWTG